MVRNTLKLTKVGGLAVAAFALLSPIQNITNVSAVDGITSGCKTQNGITECVESRNFQISVDEILDVTLTTETNNDTGSASECLTDKFGLSVSSNNVAGFRATMTSASEETALVHTDKTHKIPTLNTQSSAGSTTIGSGSWGWGRTNTGGSAPTQYNPILAKSTNQPSEILENDTTGSKSQDLYFQACADNNTISGTYSQTMLIAVVSGVHDNPQQQLPTRPDDGPSYSPSNPEGPDIVASNTGSGNRYNYGSAGTSSSADTDSDKSSTSKDTSNSSKYDGYAYPQGQTNTVSTINEGTPLATGLAITACIAAVFGIFFFILLFKHRKDDEEEEQQY